MFLILALFSGVGYFQTDAIFIHLFSNLLKGLFGYGFWVIPPAFLLTGLILLIHHGRPVRLRVACMLIAPLSIGVILQILLCKQEFTSTFGIIAALYKSGITLSSGGVVCGGIGYGFEQLFGVFASVTVCVLLTVVCLLFALQVNPKTVYEQSKNRRVEYEPEPEEERQARRDARITVKETSRRPRPQIDIPLDDEPESVIRSRAIEQPKPMEETQARGSFFNRKSNVPKPHEVLDGGAEAKPAAAIPAVQPGAPAAEKEDAPIESFVPQQKAAEETAMNAEKSAAEPKPATPEETAAVEESLHPR